MALAGDLKEITFSDVVQLCSQARRTAMLVVNCPKTGKALGFFYFEQGELFDAKFEDAHGLEAVYRALELKEGTFHVVLDVRSPERRIFSPIGAMLLEGMRRMDEASHLGDSEAGSDDLQSSLGDFDSDHSEGEDMASADSKGRVCPACGKRFNHGDVCPDDGSRLILAPTSGALAVDTNPPVRTVPPPPALSRRPARPKAILYAGIAGGAAVLLLGFLWLGRSQGPSASSPSLTKSLTAPDEAPRAPVSRPAASVPVPPPAPAAAAIQQAPAESPPKMPPAAVAPTGVRGVTDKEIVFGMAAALTGPSKELGRQMKLGIETAFNQQNDAGGVNGRQLRLISVDDGYEPTRTLPAMTELYDKDQVFGIVGNVGTPTAAVAVPYALDRKLLFFGAFTGASILRREPPDRYVFNFRASYAEETASVVNYLVKVRRIRPEQIAVFAQQDAFGDAGFAGVTKALRNLRGGDQTAILRLGYKRNTVEVTDAVARLRAHPVNIRAIVMVAAYRAAAKFIEKTREQYPNMIYTDVSFVGSTSLADELNLLGPKFAQGVIVTQVVPPVDSHSTAILKYKQALEKYFPGENVDYVSLEGYLVASVLIEGLKRVGHDVDTEKLVDTFENLRNLDLGIGTTVTFGMNEHQGSHKVWGTQLDDKGKYEILDLE
jgi:branched-chain amino acid transport system substrate-binding protein